MNPEAYRLMDDLDDSYWWYRARREIVCETVARFVPPAGRVLDYGSGSGSIALRLRSLGFESVGADVSERALAMSRRRGLPVIDLAEERLPNSWADGVLACDVLEHVADDIGLLKDLREVLRPGGLFVGTVPAYEILWSGEDFVSDHVRRYTLPGLTARLRRAGFRMVWSSYFNTLLFPLVLGAIVGKRLFRPRDMYRSNLGPLPPALNAILYRLFSLEKHLLTSLTFPFGGSILVVARRVDLPHP